MASLAGLAKYASDEEDELNAQSQPSGNNHDLKSSENKPDLESEWENFERMLSSNDDLPADQTENLKPLPVEPLTDVVNPYAYLMASMPSGSAVNANQDEPSPSVGLDVFLERAAQAAYDASQAAQADTGAGSPTHSGSRSPGSRHSGSHLDSESESASDSDERKSRSRTRSKSKDDRSKSPSQTKPSPDEKSTLADTLKKLATSKVSPDRTFSSSSRDHRRSRSSRSRSRSRRSRSRSHGRRKRKSSRSRSRSRGHRRRHHRSRSRDRSHRHHSSRSHRSHRRRSGSRHRSGRHGSSRSKRSRRDTDIRPVRRPSRLNADKRALLNTDPAAQVQALKNAAAKPEDFRTKMKRALQEAAQRAIAGQNIATPQEALIQSMAAMHAKAQELTGVEVPKFYNPAAINPLKFAEQQQKRKLLWSKVAQNKEQTFQQFQGTEVVNDEKYRKLMGIKGEMIAGQVDEEQLLKQQKLFAQLDQDYNMARLATHTHRGMGLGVVSSAYVQAAHAQSAPDNLSTEPPTSSQS